MDLKEIHREYGQSIWLDYIRRDLLQSGEFARLVKEDAHDTQATVGEATLLASIEKKLLTRSAQPALHA